MILNISKDYDKSFEKDVYKMSTSMLNIKSTHLFIASYYWDTITLELNDDMILEAAKCLPLATKSIKVKLPETITDKTVLLLTSLYPDKAGAIRKAYMFGKDVKEVLVDCVVT